MSLPQRHVRVLQQPERPAPKIDRRLKAGVDSSMVMIRLYVDESENRETDEYIFRQLLQQCKIIAKRSGLRVE